MGYAELKIRALSLKKWYQCTKIWTTWVTKPFRPFKSLKIQIAALDENHPDVGTSYKNLCLAYDSKRDYDQAFEYH